MMTLKEDSIEFFCDDCEDWGVTIMTSNLDQVDEDVIANCKRQADLVFLNEGALVRNDEVLCPICRIP